MTWAVTTRGKSKILHYWIMVWHVGERKASNKLRLFESKCGMSVLDNKLIEIRGRHCKKCVAALAKEGRS